MSTQVWRESGSGQAPRVFSRGQAIGVGDLRTASRRTYADTSASGHQVALRSHDAPLLFDLLLGWRELPDNRWGVAIAQELARAIFDAVKKA